MRRYFPAARSFLEIGCGTGFVLAGIQRAFPALALAGAEVFSEGLAHARERAPAATLFQMDARRMPFEEEFDVIGAFDVLEHIEQDVAVLAEMFRAVRPGGGIMLTVPQHPFLWSRTDEHARHKRRYTRGEMIDKVRRAGFEIARATSFVSLLLPAMALSRAAARATRRADPLPELGMGAGMNAVLTRVLAVGANADRARGVVPGRRLAPGGRSEVARRRSARDDVARRRGPLVAVFLRLPPDLLVHAGQRHATRGPHDRYRGLTR